MEKLNTAVERIIETGLLKRWEALDTWFVKFEAFSSQSASEYSVKPLALSNLWGAFVILVGGHFVAFLCLVVEVLSPRLASMAKQRLPVGTSVIVREAVPVTSLRNRSGITPRTSPIILKMLVKHPDDDSKEIFWHK